MTKQITLGTLLFCFSAVSAQDATNKPTMIGIEYTRSGSIVGDNMAGHDGFDIYLMKKGEGKFYALPYCGLSFNGYRESSMNPSISKSNEHLHRFLGVFGGLNLGVQWHNFGMQISTDLGFGYRITTKIYAIYEIPNGIDLLTRTRITMHTSKLFKNYQITVGVPASILTQYLHYNNGYFNNALFMGVGNIGIRRTINNSR